MDILRGSDERKRRVRRIIFLFLGGVAILPIAWGSRAAARSPLCKSSILN